MAFTRVLASEPHFEAVVLVMSNLVFESFDTDHDNKVDEAEIHQFIRAYQTPNASASEAFRRLDRDGDGKMTRDDAITGMRGVLQERRPDRAGQRHLRSGPTAIPANRIELRRSVSPAMPPSRPTARELELRDWLTVTIAERLRVLPRGI